MPRNKDLQAAYNKAYYVKHQARLRKKQNEYRIANQRKITAARKGLSEAQLDNLIAAQGGVCAVCRADDLRQPHIDHDHTCCDRSTSCGRCVRGILCASCNHMLGKAHDDPGVLEAGARYLREAGGR